MGKILGRIAVLLLVAGIVAGGVYLFLGTSFGRSLGQTSRGGFERGFRDREFGGGFGLGGILRDLGIIALITAIWLMLGKVFTAFVHRRSRSKPTENP